jgi:hypothetical protein
MHLPRSRTLRLGGLTLAALAVAGAGPGIAFAATNETANISAGTLTVNPPTSLAFTDTLDGTDQTALAAGTPNQTVEPVDARGSKVGWNVNETATQFKSPGTPADTLPTTALSVNGSGTSQSSTAAPTPTCHSGNSCTLPGGNAVVYPLVTSATSAKVFQANANTGLGAIDLSTNFWLSIPANTAAHSDYTASTTIAISTGP